MNGETCMHVFETPGPAQLQVEIPNGRISLTARETPQTRIELVALEGDAAAREWIAEAEVGLVGDVIVVRNRYEWRRGRMGPIEATIEAPLESAATLATGNGDIEATGRLGRVSATTGSGDVRIAECAGARARTGSGDIRIDSSHGPLDAHSGSGDVTLGRVFGDVRVGTGNGDASLEGAEGAASLTTGSGDIEVGEVGETLEAFSASGDVAVRCAGRGRVRARSVSGDVSVGVPKGVAALLDVSTLTGSIASDLEAGDPANEGERRIELTLSTVSGDVQLRRLAS